MYLGSTRIELDQQEEYKDEQEKCEEKSNYEFIWPASFDDAGCQDDAEQEECAGDDSSEDSGWWVWWDKASVRHHSTVLARDLYPCWLITRGILRGIIARNGNFLLVYTDAARCGGRWLT